MHKKWISVLFFLCAIVACVHASVELEDESRGKKKKKLGLFIYFADIVIKKIFFLKLAYAFVFWVVIHKAGYFLTWFVTYLKDKSHDHHHDHHEHYDHHYDHNPYGPYRRRKNQL